MAQRKENPTPPPPEPPVVLRTPFETRRPVALCALPLALADTAFTGRLFSTEILLADNFLNLRRTVFA